jgi:hypothetical protein
LIYKILLVFSKLLQIIYFFFICYIYKKMETIKVIEPRVNVKSDVEKNHVVLYGGLRVNEQVNVADSWGTPTTKPIQALWNIFPPSTQTITDRFMKIRVYLEVETDADLQLGTNDALRQLPISSITDVLTCQINGESISDNLGDKLHSMLCFGDRDEWNKSLSMSPCSPDNYQEYADWATYGSAKNPLANYGEASAYDPRGGFPVELLAPNKFRAVITEPILLSPFYSGKGGQEEGFVNVQQFNISYRWKTDLSKVLSHSALGNAITSVDVKFYQAPEILTTYITPDLTQPIPQLQVLPYHKPQEYIKASTPSALPSGSSVQLTSDSIKLSQIPRKMYVFVRHERSSSDYKTADSFLVMERLEVLWNNQSGLFSQCSKQELYEISRRNGCNLSYPQWSEYRGSVFCCEFGKDIGLLDNESAGVQGQYTIQVRPTFKNTSGSDFTGDFYVVMLNEGTFSIAENMGRASLGNLTPQAVLASKESDELSYQHYEDIQGGGFFSKLKHTLNKVARGVQKGARVAEKYAPMVVGAVPELAPVASALPAISRGARAVRKATGGRMAGGRLAGGAVLQRGMRRG